MFFILHVGGICIAGRGLVQYENCFVEMINRGDSLHDCWANIGGHIRAAFRRVEAMGASLGNPVQPPTVFELEAASGERVQTCELLGRNWRNWVYRVRLANRRCRAGETGSLWGRTARQRRPIARDRSLGNPLANRILLPLLEMEKRWRFLQLTRELP